MLDSEDRLTAVVQTFDNIQLRTQLTAENVKNHHQKHVSRGSVLRFSGSSQDFDERHVVASVVYFKWGGDKADFLCG